MKKNIDALLLYLILSFLLFTFLPVKAQESIELIITPNGDIVPNTALLERNGNVYSLKGDILGSVWIQANNITLDGAGHSLQWLRLRGSNLQGPSDPDCKNVIVKNIKIVNGTIGAVGGGNHTFVDNIFESSEISFMGSIGVGNDDFKNNTFVNVQFTFTYGGGSLIAMTENNFVNVKILSFISYFPKLDRNYYNDYTIKYPNATQVDNSDTWDTPYVMPIEEPGEPKANTVDNHPLINPVANFEIPGSDKPFTSPTATSLYPTNNNTLTPEPTSNKPSNFNKNLHIIIALTTILTILTCTILIKLNKNVRLLVRSKKCEKFDKNCCTFNCFDYHFFSCFPCSICSSNYEKRESYGLYGNYTAC